MSGRIGIWALGWLVAWGACSGSPPACGEDAATTKADACPSPTPAPTPAPAPTPVAAPARFESIGLWTPSPYAPG